MNVKTTIVLTVVALTACLGYFFWNQQRHHTSDPSADAVPHHTRTHNHLTQPPLDDHSEIIEVRFKRRGGAQLVFERNPHLHPEQLWNMVEPARCAATDWMVANVILAVKRLHSTSTLSISAGDITFEQAGLKPVPVAVCSVKTDQGVSVEVHVGKPLLGQAGVYVYLPSKPDHVFVTDDHFGNILERDDTGFRSRRLISSADDATVVAMSITERINGRVVTYDLRKHDAGWRFHGPFESAANAEYIDAFAASIRRLWVRSWLTETSQSLSEFGLAEPHLKISVTTAAVPTSQPTTSSSNADAQHTHSFSVSNKTPIDDESQVYVAREGSTQVGLINLEHAQELIPNLRKWRDMTFLDRPVLDCTAILVRHTAGDFQIVREDNRWVFNDTREVADTPIVDELLATIEALQAVNYASPHEAPVVQVKQPECRVVLSRMFDDNPLEIRIGEHTESVAKRLRWVQITGSPDVAKIDEEQLAPLMRDRTAYRDRRIISVEPARLQKIDIARQILDGRVSQHITLARDDTHVWMMVSPGRATVDLKRVNELAKNLANWRAASIVDEINPTVLGLDHPHIRVALTIEGLPVLSTEDGQQTMTTEPASIIQVDVAEKDGRYFGRRLDQNISFELTSDVYNGLSGELLDPSLWTFDPKNIVQFEVTDQGQAIVLSKQHDRWTYMADVDIPIDSNKVDTYLSQVSGYDAVRYVSYNASNLQQYGLDAPRVRLRLEQRDGTIHELIVSGQYIEQGRAKRHYAAVVGTDRILLIDSLRVKHAALTLDRLEP